MQREKELLQKNVSKAVNNTSEKYITQKFIREFRNIIMTLAEEGAEDSHDTENPQISPLKTLNYLKLKEFLVCLGMMTEAASNQDSKERTLLYDMWKLLRGEDKQEVNVEDVRIVTMVINRMTDDKRIGVEGFAEDIGFFNENDQFCLRMEDVPKMQKHYELLYLNRLHHIGKILEHSKAQKAQADQYEFKPKLNENTN